MKIFILAYAIVVSLSGVCLANCPPGSVATTTCPPPGPPSPNGELLPDTCVTLCKDVNSASASPRSKLPDIAHAGNPPHCPADREVHTACWPKRRASHEELKLPIKITPLGTPQAKVPGGPLECPEDQEVFTECRPPGSAGTSSPDMEPLSSAGAAGSDGSVSSHGCPPGKVPTKCPPPGPPSPNGELLPDTCVVWCVPSAESHARKESRCPAGQVLSTCEPLPAQPQGVFLPDVCIITCVPAPQNSASSSARKAQHSAPDSAAPYGDGAPPPEGAVGQKGPPPRPPPPPPPPPSLVETNHPDRVAPPLPADQGGPAPPPGSSPPLGASARNAETSPYRRRLHL